MVFIIFALTETLRHNDSKLWKQLTNLIAFLVHYLEAIHT